MKLLPIEPGCLAIVISTCEQFRFLRGCEVKVGRRLHIDEVISEDGTCKACGNSTGYFDIGRGHVCCCECSLMRVDGGDFSHEREATRQHVPACELK